MENKFTELITKYNEWRMLEKAIAENRPQNITFTSGDVSLVSDIANNDIRVEIQYTRKDGSICRHNSTYQFEWLEKLYRALKEFYNENDGKSSSSI